MTSHLRELTGGALRSTEGELTVAAPKEVGAVALARGELPQASMPALDVLRFLSVCAIAWFHAGGPGSSFLTFRLPAVALITALVQTRSMRWHPRGVLAPWLFWYAVYGALLLWKATQHGSSVIPPELAWYNPFVGPTWHLWYGPFALIAGYLAHRWRSESSLLLLALAAASFAVAFDLRDAPFPKRAWAEVLPAIPVGILLARETTRPRDVILTVVAGFIALGAPYVIAIPLVWTATRWRGQRLRHLACFGRGVYWVHVLASTALTKFAIHTPARALLLAFAISGALMLTRWARLIL